MNVNWLDFSSLPAPLTAHDKPTSASFTLVFKISTLKPEVKNKKKDVNLYNFHSKCTSYNMSHYLL